MSSSFLLVVDGSLALTNLSWIDVGLGLRTIGQKGVSLSSRALLIDEELTPGVKIDSKRVTSASRVLLSGGCRSSFLFE